MVKVASIEKESTVDGDGWRYVIFAQGCSHNCLGCHNPSTHDFNAGVDMDETEIIEQIFENPLIEGITLSGGDPFFQAKELTMICCAVKTAELTVWAYTGFTFEKFLDFINGKETDSRINKDMINLLNYIDVVVDGPFILSERTLDLRYRGSRNQRLINVKESLKQNKVVEYILQY